MSVKKHDICVIGGGPGGYVAAIRAAQKGADVALIEKEELGGTCLNRGCIPTKVYLRHSEFIEDLKEADKLGINIDGWSTDWKKMRNRKAGVVGKLTGGVGYLLKKNGVKVYKGTGELLDNKMISITGKDEGKIEAGNIILATGSEPIVPRIKGVDLPGVITSREALDLEELPESLLIIGGGVIGVEMAFVFNSLGVKVTVVELMNRLLPGFEKEISTALATKMETNGISVKTGSRVMEINDADNKLNVMIATSQSRDEIGTEQVLVAIGRKPIFSGFHKQKLTIKDGFVAVDSQMRTNKANIYAIGDITGGKLLAHVASAEGIVAAENAAGGNKNMDYSAVPGCVYTIPEIATVGMTEEEAVKNGFEIKVGKFPYEASGKALAAGHQEGLVKIVTDKKWDQILGVHIMGLHATELIAEAVLAIRLEATAEVLAETIHAHPTLSETLMEAAHDVHNLAIHV